MTAPVDLGQAGAGGDPLDEVARQDGRGLHHLFANEPSGTQSSQAIEFGLDGSVIKKFASNGSTLWLGNVQRLPGGNTLINCSTGPIQEVAPDGTIVLQVDAGVFVGFTEFRKSLYGPPLDVQQ